MSPALYRVFELVNFDAAEIVIGVAPTTSPSGRLTRDAARLDWKEKHRVTFRIIEDNLRLEQAAQFALSYSESAALKPFTVYLGPDLTEASEKTPAR